MGKDILLGGIVNVKEVEEDGDDPIRVPIRPIFCMDCGARRLLGYNVANEGYVDEGRFLTALEVTVCPECVQNYAEPPEGGWKEHPLTQAIALCNKLVEKVLAHYEVATIEELNDIDELETIAQEMANGLVAVLGMIEDAHLPDN